MSDDLLKTLLPAIDIAAFERRADGTFSGLAPRPPWFSRLVADTTFPFLGHILEEAVEFWGTGVPGHREWGPCEEVDGAGRPFHYKVSAVTAGARQFLLFHLDPESDRMREVLQKVRENALASGSRSTDRDLLRTVQGEVRQARSEIDDLIQQLLASSSREEQIQVTRTLAEKCGHLANAVDTLAAGAAPPAKS